MSKILYFNSVNYEKKYGNITMQSIQNDSELSKAERETNIIINDDEEMVSISSAQEPVITYLLLEDNYFILDIDGLLVKNGKIVGINGFIPKKHFKSSKINEKIL